MIIGDCGARRMHADCGHGCSPAALRLHFEGGVGSVTWLRVRLDMT